MTFRPEIIPGRSCVALCLGNELTVALIEPKEVGNLCFASNEFVDQGHGGFMGFHDWLRKAGLPKQIHGVRFWPHEVEQAPVRLLAHRPYVSAVADGKGFEIWFVPQRDYDQDMSCDQAFGLNRVLISTDESQATLVLDMHDLSPEELYSIEKTLTFDAAVWI